MTTLLAETKIYSNVSHKIILPPIYRDEMLVCFFFVIFSPTKTCLEVELDNQVEIGII